MDLKEIKEKSPLAWKAFKDWYYACGHFPVHPDGLKAYPHEFQAGCLYGFLDHHSITVGMFANTSGRLTPMIVAHIPGVPWRMHDANVLEADDRHIAEKEAFTKAFQILEFKLTAPENEQH